MEDLTKRQSSVVSFHSNALSMKSQAVTYMIKPTTAPQLIPVITKQLIIIVENISSFNGKEYLLKS